MRKRIIRRDHVLPFSGLFWSMRATGIRSMEHILQSTLVQQRLFGRMNSGLGRDVHDSFKRMWLDIAP